MHETNEEFIQRIMTVGCPTGALVQVFVLDALEKYAMFVASSQLPTWGEDGLIDKQAWIDTAEWVLKEIQQKYEAK